MTIIQKAQSTKVGYGVSPPSELAPPSILLADNIDIQTGDFVSLTVGVDPIDAQVMIALKVVRGSGAVVMEDGARFGTIKKLTASFEKDVKAVATEALKRLIDNRDIRIKLMEVTVLDPGNQTGELTVQYLNLRAANNSVRKQTVPVDLSRTGG